MAGRTSPPGQAHPCAICGATVPSGGPALCSECFYQPFRLAGEPAPQARDVEPRLAVVDPAWVERETAALAALGDSAVPPLAAIVESSRDAPARVAAANVLSLIASEAATTALLGKLTGTQRSVRPMAQHGACLSLAAAVVLALFAIGSGSTAVWAATDACVAVALALLVTSVRRGSRERSGLSVMIGGLRGPEAAGTLALTYADEHLRPAAHDALCQSLMRVTEESGKALSERQRAAILNLLNIGDYKVLRAALFALSRFAGENAEGPIARVVSTQRELRRRIESGDAVTREDRELMDQVPPSIFTGNILSITPGFGQERTRVIVADTIPPDLLEVAEAALAAVQRRAEREREATLLLRASSGEGIEEQDLLRPAAGQDDPKPEQLLKNHEGEEAEGA